MEIPFDVCAKYLVPKDYVKPSIEIGNYFFDWNKASFGIPRREVPEFRAFLRDAIPQLNALYIQVNDLQQNISKAKILGKRLSFLPSIHISYHGKTCVVYELLMTRDGKTLVDRKEDIFAVGNNEDGRAKSSMLAISWKLGELLFDRQPKKSRQVAEVMSLNMVDKNRSFIDYV